MKAAHPPGGRAKNVYFAGCTTSYVEYDIGQASVRLLDKAGVDFVHLGKEENCCGTPLKDPPVAAEIGKVRLDEALETGAQKVLSPCPCCHVQLRVTVDKKGTHKTLPASRNNPFSSLSCPDHLPTVTAMRPEKG